MQNLLNYNPNLFVSAVNQPGYESRADRMAKVRAARLAREEEEKKEQEIEKAQAGVVNPGAPDGPQAGNVPPSAPALMPN